jgi:hypothetical protein
MDALYEDTAVLDQMRADMGIQKGIEIHPGVLFSQYQREAKTIAQRRARQSQEKAKVTILKREELIEYD